MFGLFWLTYLAWYDPVHSLNVLKGFHIVFITFSTLLALGIGVVVHLGRSRRRRAGLPCRRDLVVHRRVRPARLRRLVLAENEDGCGLIT